MRKSEEISAVVQRKLEWLTPQRDTAPGKANLVKLRRGAGSEPGMHPELMGLILGDIPESYLSKNGVPRCEEWCVYTALTLYALHQQGESLSMHTEEKRSVGKALALLGKTESDKNAQERVQRRFQILVRSRDMREMSYRLRGIVQLLRDESIALNYAGLAGDLYDFQREEAKARLFLRWGQDMFWDKDEDEDDH